MFVKVSVALLLCLGAQASITSKTSSDDAELCPSGLEILKLHPEHCINHHTNPLPSIAVSDVIELVE